MFPSRAVDRRAWILGGFFVMGFLGLLALGLAMPSRAMPSTAMPSTAMPSTAMPSTAMPPGSGQSRAAVISAVSSRGSGRACPATGARPAVEPSSCSDVHAGLRGEILELAPPPDSLE